MMKNLICRLRELLIYTLTEIPVVLLVEVWAIGRVLTIMLIVVYLILGNFWKDGLGASILNFFK